ncbi:unnamed protein product [Effrenium voratum]|uniref:Uncharacterized protein n=1 Tax=Effrenium voratum TaxID=2562239 RepID=A0AA36N4L1_9DINO|nr:unnamed protein product [Effrenium voratum]
MSPEAHAESAHGFSLQELRRAVGCEAPAMPNARNAELVPLVPTNAGERQLAMRRSLCKLRNSEKLYKLSNAEYLLLAQVQQRAKRELDWWHRVTLVRPIREENERAFEELTVSPNERFQRLMAKDSNRYETLVLAVEVCYLIMYFGLVMLQEFAADDKAPEFYQVCVAGLAQKGQLPPPGPGPYEPSITPQRLQESIEVMERCDAELLAHHSLDFAEDFVGNRFIPLLVVILRAWRLFGCHDRCDASKVWSLGRRPMVRWMLDTAFHTCVMSWYGLMAGLYSTLSLLPFDDDKFESTLYLGPTVYVFLLTALCLTVLDKLQTLITCTISFGVFVVPPLVALVQLLDQKGRQVSLMLHLMNQFTLIIAVAAVCVARWSSWHDKQTDFRREEQLKTGIVNEKVKRCQAEFAAQRLTQEKAPDCETSYLEPSEHHGFDQSVPWASLPHLSAHPPSAASVSAASAPANMDRLAHLQGTSRCDCLPMGAKVYTDSHSQGMPASELQAGDKVLCYDHLAGSIRYVEISDCGVVSGECDWSRITMADGTAVSVTAEHPVRVVGQLGEAESQGVWGLGGGQVMPAGQLRPGKDMLKILRLGAVPVQTMHIESDVQPRVRVNLRQRYSLFCSQGAGADMTAVAVESSDALAGRQMTDLQVQNTFIGGCIKEDTVPRKPLSAPGAVVHPVIVGREAYEPKLEDIETDLGDSGVDTTRASSASEDPDQLHAKGCCQPCLFQSRYYADPEKYPACTKPDCLARLCHLQHSEEYISKYKAQKRSYEKKNRLNFRKEARTLQSL